MRNIKVKIHPVVLVNVIDSYERRDIHQHRVIGTLLGNVDKSGCVEVTNSFIVKHKEGNGEVAVDINVAKDLYELYQRVNSNEKIVGWFAAGGSEVDEHSVFIHEYYSRETNNPIHITVNQTPTGISIKGFVSTSFGIPNKTTGTMFSPIKDISYTAGYKTEMIGLKACMNASKSSPKSFQSELEMILSGANESMSIVEKLVNFIDEKILNSPGKAISANVNDVGRQLMSIVENISPFVKDDESMNRNLNDLLMIIYLTNLCKTQLAMSEKLLLL